MLMLFSYLKDKFGYGSKAPSQIESTKSPLFILSFRDNPIGTLSFEEGYWSFKYSEWFKNQSDILPLLEFPDKQKEYTSRSLWSFFSSRIPSAINMKKEQGEIPNFSETNLVELLKKFGKKTINNPFVLQPT